MSVSAILNDPQYEKEVAASTDRNYVLISRIVVKLLAVAEVSGSAHRVAWALLDCISEEYKKGRVHYCSATYVEIMEITHLSKQGVSNGLSQLVESGVVVKDKVSRKEIRYGFNILFDKEGKKKNMNAMNPLSRKKDKDGWKPIPYRRKNLSDWDRYHFSSYVRDKLMSRAKSKNRGEINLIINKVIIDTMFCNLTSIIDEMSGQKCCNLLIKAYFDWFIQNKAPDLWDKQNKEVRFANFTQSSRVEMFFKEFKLNSRSSRKKIASTLTSYDHVVDEASKTSIVEGEALKKQMEEMYDIGIKSLLIEFGVVLCANYVSVEHGESISDLKKEISEKISKSSRGAVQKIIDKTFYYAPYPESFSLLNWQEEFKQSLPYLGGREMALSDGEDYYSYEFLLKGA